MGCRIQIPSQQLLNPPLLFTFSQIRKSKLQNTRTRGCVSHNGLAIYIKKYLKAKEKLYGNSNNSPSKNIIFQKIL
jgi:hypothetical protein